MLKGYTRAISATLVLATLCAGPTLGASVELPTTLNLLLIDGEFTSVGGATFSDFSYSRSGDMPIAEQIQVNANNSQDGLMFTGAFLDLPGGPGNGASEATLGYDVTGGPFVQVKLAGNPALSGAEAGISSVTETLLETGLPEPVQLSVFNNLIPGEIPLRVEDSQTLSNAISAARVEVGMLLRTDDPEQSVTLTFTDQAFVVPEPTGLLLIVVGMLGCGLLRRRA